MRIPVLQACVISCAMASAIFIMTPVHQALAEDSKQSFGGIEARKWVLGARAGFSPLTQSLTDNDPRISTDVGPLVNFQALYSLNTWLLVGMMLEWERHGVVRERRFGDLDLGHQDTVSVLPTVELRPVKLGPVVPYANMSFGVNVNSFGESTDDRISPSNTFAWRLGWGADYMLNQQFALNVEMAYKRNDGHARIDGDRVNDWNASSFGFLFGAKLFF
ncbi:MAG: outer membrane beta-barrel protein [Nitrospira sp.]|jgi:opacity protein-like surface antigen|nr:outer membrane beta-barrel protein [Nitrospira sp.]